MQNAIKVSLRSAKPKRYQVGECFCFLQLHAYIYECACVYVYVLELLPTRVACQISKSGRIVCGRGAFTYCLPKCQEFKLRQITERQRESEKEELFYFLLLLLLSISIDCRTTNLSFLTDLRRNERWERTNQRESVREHKTLQANQIHDSNSRRTASASACSSSSSSKWRRRSVLLVRSSAYNRRLCRRCRRLRWDPSDKSERRI